MDFRIGNGFDVHRLVPGRKLVLGGVEIPFEKGLEGHSDADLLLHAIMDSLLGAAALGDIGTHFPPSDIQYKDISSIHLLKEVRKLIRSLGYRISNVDSTLVAETPKMAPHILQMRKNIAEALEIDLNQVSVKATTTEGLGYAGRGEGMGAYATALLMKNKL